MKKIEPHTMVGHLTVERQVSHRDSVILQWYVATADGTLIFGPFSSLEEAVEIGRTAQIDPSNNRS